MTRVRYLVPRDMRDVGPRRGDGLGWEGCPQFDSPEAAAEAWHAVAGLGLPLRVRRAGVIGYGTAAEVAPVYAALSALRAAP